jgi:hypothetical protein
VGEVKKKTQKSPTPLFSVSTAKSPAIPLQNSPKAYLEMSRMKTTEIVDVVYVNNVI